MDRPSVIVAGAMLLLAACGEPTQEPSADEGPPGQINVYPTVLDLGELRVQQQASSSFRISNVGAGPLEVYDVAFSDDTRRPHWLLSGGRSGVLAPGESIELGVVARPLDLSNPAVQLLVRSDDPSNAQVSVQLLADARGEPSIRVEPGQLSFGAVSIGESVTQQVQILNDGTEPLGIDSVVFVNYSPGFSLGVDPSGALIEPERDDGLIEVTFTPREAGVSTDRLVIRSDDPDAPEVELVVTGQGLP